MFAPLHTPTTLDAPAACRRGRCAQRARQHARARNVRAARRAACGAALGAHALAAAERARTERLCERHAQRARAAGGTGDQHAVAGAEAARRERLHAGQRDDGHRRSNRRRHAIGQLRHGARVRDRVLRQRALTLAEHAVAGLEALRRGFRACAHDGARHVEPRHPAAQKERHERKRGQLVVHRVHARAVHAHQQLPRGRRRHRRRGGEAHPVRPRLVVHDGAHRGRRGRHGG